MHPTSLLFGSEDYAFTHPAPIPVSGLNPGIQTLSSPYQRCLPEPSIQGRETLSSPLRGAAGGRAVAESQASGQSGSGGGGGSHRLTDGRDEKNCRHTPHSSAPTLRGRPPFRNISPVYIRLQRLFPHSRVCTECTIGVLIAAPTTGRETDGLSSSGNGCHTMETPCLSWYCLHPPFSLSLHPNTDTLGTPEYHPCP